MLHGIALAGLTIFGAVVAQGAPPVAPPAGTMAPLASPAAAPGPNVTVSGCKAQLDKPQLRIAYTNDAPRTATEIDFVVRGSAGTIQTVKDAGKFATGVPIVHVYELPDGASPLGLSSARCIVTKVVYVDGTIWLNPNP